MKRFAVYFILLILILSACTEKKYLSGDNILIRFSTDEVHFDTVFTSLGTATRELRVINPYDGWLKFDRIGIAGGANSPFRLNIDGSASNSRSDINVAPGDSIFIFIDAIIDPNNNDNPISIIDSIVFEFHGNQTDINILAWGQDINLLVGEEVGTETWSGSKPYVVYNSILVDTAEILTIEEGVKVLFHRGSTMYISGTLIVNGTYENPVLFSSDRYEEIYDDIPGQWAGMYFLNGSTNNVINNLDLRNAISAIHLGNLGSADSPPDLLISNSTILHNTISGISSLGAEVEAVNCVISHCGYNSVFLALGGEYSFIHCTINSFWDYSSRFSPGVYLSDFYEYDGSVLHASSKSFDFSNTVITGSLNNEILVDSYGADNPGVTFNTCFLKLEEENDIWSLIDLSNSILNEDPLFISSFEYDLRPDTLSPLIGLADPGISLLYDTDLRGFSRFSDFGPDIGAYERQIGERSK